MKPVRFAALAEDEFYDSILFYEEQVPGLGTEFDSEVQLAISDIQRDPERFPTMTGDSEIRRFVMKRFPFIICFVALTENI